MLSIIQIQNKFASGSGVNKNTTILNSGILRVIRQIFAINNLSLTCYLTEIVLCTIISIPSLTALGPSKETRFLIASL